MTPRPSIYLVRHGETAWSLSGQHTGRTEVPLTPQGEAMARGLAAQLQGIAFAQVLTSPRLRARQTCELAGLGGSGGGGGVAAQTEPNLAEWDYGEYEGLRSNDIQRSSPDWDIWTDGCPGGETPAQVAARADRLIEGLLVAGAATDPADPADPAKANGPIAVFSHGHFGRVLAARWIGLPVFQGRHFTLAPASISVLGFDPRHPQQRVIALWNALGSLHR